MELGEKEPVNYKIVQKEIPRLNYREKNKIYRAEHERPIEYIV